MTKTIAIAGKGGTGKTTIAALLIKLLSQKGLVLAVDADPSTNLNLALGLPLELKGTVGQVREKLTQDVSKGFDLLAMGRPEGPGCYCAPNEFLRASLDKLVKDYKYRYIVMDCEAGMEHISRQTTRDVDILLIISNPTMKSITVAARIKELIGELRTAVGRVALIVNRVNGTLPPEIEKAIADSGLELTATISEDPYMSDLEIKGRPIIELPQDSPLQQGVREIMSKVGL